jgi:hypothetical protein
MLKYNIMKRIFVGYKDNNKTDLKEIGCVVMDCILVAQEGNRWWFPVKVTNYWFSKKVRNFFIS